MSEQTDNTQLESQQPVQEPECAPESPPAGGKADKAPISAKKRTALLRYMAVLFGVAFLLVLLSFLIQIRDSRETISDLNQSNASALQNALKLQEANQALTEDKNSLTAQLEETEQQLEDANQEIADQKAQQEESAAAFAEEQSLRESYELLFTAIRLFNSGAYEDCMNVLNEELQPEDVESFHEDAKAYYDQLKARCQEEIDTAAPAAED